MSDDHSLLRDALIGRLANASPAEAWDRLGDAGVHGLVIGEALGGAGLSIADAAPVMDVLGELCIATPFLETSIVAASLLAGSSDPGAETVLRSIAQDGACVAVAGLDPRLARGLRARRTSAGWRLDGSASVVIGVADAASLLVVAASDEGPALFALPVEEGIVRRQYPTIDGRRAADLDFDGASVRCVAEEAGSRVGQVTDAAFACLAVEAAALMRRLVRDTADYLRQREQFGQPIARFQVVQHRLVDMHIEARRAAAIAGRAINALSGTEEERARSVSAAKVATARSGRYVGQQAVQLHGGMGMTEELPIGTLFKRLTVIEDELGSADDALRRFASVAAV